MKIWFQIWKMHAKKIKISYDDWCEQNDKQLKEAFIAWSNNMDFPIH